MTEKKPPVQKKNDEQESGAGDVRAAVARVEFLSMGTREQEAVSGQIIVVCRQPGLRRGGRVHPPLAVYEPGELRLADLEAMEREPLLEVIEVL